MRWHHVAYAAYIPFFNMKNVAALAVSVHMRSCWQPDAVSVVVVVLYHCVDAWEALART